MITFIWDNKFKRNYKKRIESDEDLRLKFINVLIKFDADPFDSTLRTHKLSGKLKELWSF